MAGDRGCSRMKDTRATIRIKTLKETVWAWLRLYLAPKRDHTNTGSVDSRLADILLKRKRIKKGLKQTPAITDSRYCRNVDTFLPPSATFESSFLSL